jgi:hypothetical protein
MVARRAGLALLVGCLLSTGVAAQHRGLRFAGAGAGLYFGSPSSLNGPMFYVRFLTLPEKGASFGLRAEYRDDDNSSGRAQALSAGGELHLSVGGEEARVFVPLGLALDFVSLSGPSPYTPPDAKTGLYGRYSFGLGAALGSRDQQFELEWRHSRSRAGSYWSLTGGARSVFGTAPQGAAMRLTASAIKPYGSTYRTEPDFTGYGMSLEWPYRLGPASHLRVGLGIDFMRFPGYSTGVVQTLAGVTMPIVTTSNGAISVAAVPQVGWALFVEGEESAMPLATLGLETTARFGAVGVMGGLTWLAATGPAGAWAGWQPRFGIVVGL